MAVDIFRDIITANRAGRRCGIASWCTAHEHTLRAVLQAHRHNTLPILIEATCNQVNHHGGYTGMTPAAFRHFVERLAKDTEIAVDRIVLGGDHLGPNPWKQLPAAQAMDEAKSMVKAYVEAGFSKIHLDASMACADDGKLAESEMANRAAALCAVAEAAKTGPLCYVIGTEVPVPGGETETLDSLVVTQPDAARGTFALHQQAFRALGLRSAEDRIIGIVVQPGVDFGNSQVFAYDAAKAGLLAASVLEFPGIVFEAHSTDYQSKNNLSGLVAHHFAILKVGPELTFAYREAVFAMAAIEDQLPVKVPSRVIEVIDQVTNDDDRNWRNHVPAGEQQRALKLFGFSDRIRYYWLHLRIDAAVRQLCVNIDGMNLPRGLVKQYANELDAVPPGLLFSNQLIQKKVGGVVNKYLDACGFAT
jgi:D-tagatose-bisphosphate aldolase class II non-catalytic subunit